jgi:uncharacterized membrane protein
MLFVLNPLGPFLQAEFVGLTISTSFPGQTVPPGESFTLPIEVQAYGLTPQAVTLEVLEAPAGWQVHFIGGGKVVSSVFLAVDAVENLTLKVEPPAEAALAEYNILLEARAAEASAQLALQLTIGEVFPPELTLEVELPNLRGSPTAAFNFRGTLRNESEQDMVVALEAQAPEGFEVRFKLGTGGQEVSSLPIQAGDSESITMEVRAPDATTAGEYPITVTATSEVAADELALTAVVTGRPELSMTTPDGRLSGRVYSGRETALQIVVRNDGTAEGQAIALDASEPSGWTVTFSPERIDSLAVGGETEVTVNIVPAEKAVAGDYMISLSAAPDNGSRESNDFRITLLTSTLWGVVGLVLIAAALAVVALAVSRFGRR